jgi:caffeoyl-CoA O-methyltransferase
MTPKSFFLSPEVHRYIVEHGRPPDPLLARLAEETRELVGDLVRMQVAPEQGAFLEWLTRLVDARVAVEVGTFTGYSAICIARGLAPGGRLTCFDVSEEWTAVARRYWEEAGLDDRIELRLGPAADTLAALPEEPEVDLAFIDADKESYEHYVDLLADRMRPGGVIGVDNTLWHGAVADPSVDDPTTQALRAFNDARARDERFDPVLLSLGDGLTLLRRRPS